MEMVTRIMKRAGAVLCAVVVTAAGASDVQAQGNNPSPLKVTYTNLSVQRDAERSKQASPVVAGNDTLRYELTFTNGEKRTLGNVVFNNPIPKGLTMVAGTVTTSANAKVEYSIDGIEYSARPMMTVLENGRTVQRIAPTSLYKNIRWTVVDSIAPNTSITARFDATVVVRN